MRSMEGESLGVVSGGKKTSWDLFNFRRNVGDVGEAGVDLRREDLKSPPGLFDMADANNLKYLVASIQCPPESRLLRTRISLLSAHGLLFSSYIHVESEW